MAMAASSSLSSTSSSSRTTGNFFSPPSSEATIPPSKYSSSSSASSVSLPPCRASLRSFSLSTLIQSTPRSANTSRFISILSVSKGSRVNRNSGQIVALDPDFYKIPYVEGVPVGTRLKLWNLPPNCDHGEMFEWLNSIPDVKAHLLEFTDDPDLNAQGVGGFVEFETKQQACMAIVRLDGRKFKGRCIRMDFVEKKPHEREIGGRRNRPSRNNYSRGGGDYGNSSVPNFEPRGGAYGVNTATVPTVNPTSSPSPPRTYAPLPSHRIFVGNLPWTIDDNGLHSLFSSYGSVLEARVMRDRDTGSSRGFGFVAMSSADEMNAAISGLDGKPVDGRALKVNVASSR